jgi:hypothetical protein
MLVDNDSVGDDLVVAEVAELTKTVTVNITDDGVCGAVDKCVQTDILEKHQSMCKLTPHGGFTIGDFKHDPDGLKFYTSLESYRVFFQGLASLGPAASELTYLNGVKPASSEPNQIFMYLIELGRLSLIFSLVACLHMCIRCLLDICNLDMHSQVFSAMKSVYGLAEKQ